MWGRMWGYRSVTSLGQKWEQPVGGPLWPCSDEVFGWSKAVTVAAGRIDVQFDRNFGFVQRRGVKQGVFDANRVVCGHGKERRRCVCCDLQVRGDLVIFLFDDEIAGINHEGEIGPATDRVGIVHSVISAFVIIVA